MDTHHLHSSSSPLLDEHFSRRASIACGLDVDVRDGRLWLSHRSIQSRAAATVALLIGVLLLTLPLMFGDLLPAQQAASIALEVASFVFGAALVLIALYLPFSRVNVWVGRAEIERIRCWSGISLGRRSVPTADVEELQIDVGRHGISHASYDLVGLGPFGRLTLLDSVPDRTLLEMLRRQIMLAAGIRPSGTY